MAQYHRAGRLQQRADRVTASSSARPGGRRDRHPGRWHAGVVSRRTGRPGRRQSAASSSPPGDRRDRNGHLHGTCRHGVASRDTSAGSPLHLPAMTAAEGDAVTRVHVDGYRHGRRQRWPPNSRRQFRLDAASCSGLGLAAERRSACDQACSRADESGGSSVGRRRDHRPDAVVVGAAVATIFGSALTMMVSCGDRPMARWVSPANSRDEGRRLSAARRRRSARRRARPTQSSSAADTIGIGLIASQMMSRTCELFQQAEIGLPGARSEACIAAVLSHRLEAGYSIRLAVMDISRHARLTPDDHHQRSEPCLQLLLPQSLPVALPPQATRRPPPRRGWCSARSSSWRRSPTCRWRWRTSRCPPSARTSTPRKRNSTWWPWPTRSAWPARCCGSARWAIATAAR